MIFYNLSNTAYQQINVSEMSSNTLVDQAGTIKNIQHIGFTNTSAFGELIDNSNDAGAKEVRIGVFKWTDEDGNTHYGYYIADDGTGMNREKLSQSFQINHPQDGDNQSFGDKSGRFGMGGSAALIVISKTSGKQITKISRSSESRQLFAVEVVYDRNQTLPLARPLIDEQKEFWSRLAVQQAGTGTLIIGEVDEATYVGIQRLMNDKSTNGGLPWYIATTFARKISAEPGLTISIRANDDAPFVVVPPFNSIGSLDDTRVTRVSHDVLILKDKTTAEFRFALRDSDDDESMHSLPLNTQAKVNAKWQKLRLESYEVIDIVQIILALSQKWNEIHEEQTRGQFITGKLTDFREKSIARRYIRSDRCVKSIPTPKRKQGDKAEYPFYENVIQEITMHATEVSDKLFGVVVNKSQLDETKIDLELKKLIDHLSNVFSNKLYKENVPESQRKKKSRSSDDDATSVASDVTVDCLLNDDVASLSPNTSARAHREQLSLAVAGGGNVKKTVKLSILKEQPQQREPLHQEQEQEQEAAVAAVELVQEQPPVISTVSSHTALKITRATGLSYIRRLYEEQEHTQIVEVFNTLIRKHQDPMFKPHVDVFLMFMQPVDKYRMLTHLLDTGSPDVFMKGGSKLYRAYHEYYSE